MSYCHCAPRTLAAAVGIAVFAITPAAAQRKPTAPDTLSQLQSMNAFNSLDDGQPGSYGRWTLEINVGRANMPDIVNSLETFTALEYTGESTRFLRNIEISLVVPIRFRPGSTKLGRPILAWQQRWVADTVAMMTVGSLLEYELQTQGEAGDAAAAVSGILVKQVGVGNLFLNVVAGSDERPALSLWGARIGYDWWLNQKVSVVADYEFIQIVDSAAQNVLELAGTFIISHRVSIGPGVLIGLSRNKETPRSGAGVRIIWVL